MKIMGTNSELKLFIKKCNVTYPCEHCVLYEFCKDNNLDFIDIDKVNKPFESTFITLNKNI